MSFEFDIEFDDDNEFELSTELNTLKENKNNQTIEISNIRTEKINKLRLEEENIKAIYEAKMRDVEERMFVLMNTSDEELFNDSFQSDLNELEIQFNTLFGKGKFGKRKDRSALGLGLRIGDRIKFSIDENEEWLCECIGLEKRGVFGVLQSPKNERFQGRQFKSLNKIYQLFLETNGMKKRAIYRSKNVEWFRDGNSLGCFE